MVLVDSDEVCAAMKDLFENVRAVAEPSGALGSVSYTHLDVYKRQV